MATTPSASDLIAVLDGGTTRTRLRLCNGQSILWHQSRAIGARDVAQKGRGELIAAVIQLLGEARAFARFDAVIASGMISSNNGLVEVPHLTAPVTYAGLAAGIVACDLPSIGTVHFIPGIRTMTDDVQLSSILNTDVMRGEETEIMGLRDLLNLEGMVNFFHAGSHHKVICTDNQQILSSATAMSGEILHVLVNNTILSSSVTPLETLGAVDVEYWTRGFEAAQTAGFARAAFCVRLLDQLMHAPASKATAYLLGAIASLDLGILKTDAPLVLYGHLTITEPLATYLAQRGNEVSVVTKEMSEAAAVHGAALLWRSRLGLLFDSPSHG